MQFKGLAKVQIQNGASCLLWDDLWADEILHQKFPELYSFAKNKKISYLRANSEAQLYELFHLPLSQQAHQQCNALQDLLNQNQMLDQNDTWSFIWNSSSYSVKKAYQHLSGHQHLHPIFKWLWKSSCQSKHKVFFWLVLKDRLSTRELLARKNMQLPDYTCVLCTYGLIESLFHMLLECPFAIQCWGLINITVQQNMDPSQTLQSFKDQLNVPFFMEAIIIMAWTIWSVRNDFIFRGIQPSIHGAKAKFTYEWRLLLYRTKPSYHPIIDLWTANLL
jgi:hypothetical protein